MRRPYRLALVLGALTAAGAYACSSSSSNPTPPLNDAGDDGGQGEGGTADGGSDGGGDGGAPSVACNTLPGQIVYIESGDTQEALLKRVGRRLRDSFNVTIVFQLTGSCTLTPNLFAGTPIAAGTSMLYIPSTAENPSWTAASAESTCTVTAATPPNLGISALYTGSCGLGGPPAGIGLISGPIQAYTFIVPPSAFANGQTAIYAEEAHAAFGALKGTGLVTWNGSPEWNDVTQMFFRPSSKSTLVSTAFNIKVKAADMAAGAVQEAKSTDVLSAVAAATSPNAIGILGDEVYDSQGRGKVNALAFRAYGQNLAYYPDSTVSAFDKQNIRDGHYTMWSPTVYITAVDGTNAPTNAAVKTITDQVLGNPGSASDGGMSYPGIDDVVGVGLTPSCAMQVTRATPTDGTPLSPYTPDAPCTCYFLSKIHGATGTPANCTTCTSNAQCTSPQTCLRGFCEGPGAGIAAVPADGGAGCISNLDASTDSAADIPNGCTGATAIMKAPAPVITDAGPG